MLSEPLGLSSGSKTIAKIILMRIRYSICESKYLDIGFLNFFFLKSGLRIEIKNISNYPGCQVHSSKFMVSYFTLDTMYSLFMAT